MSVLIKGMEMPEKQVYVILNPNGLVEALDANNVLLEEYQAVPIPPHGRLIDADALMNKINNARLLQPEIEDVYVDDYIIVGDWLRSASTVIEAEGGDA